MYVCVWGGGRGVAGVGPIKHGTLITLSSFVFFPVFISFFLHLLFGLANARLPERVRRPWRAEPKRRPVAQQGDNSDCSRRVDPTIDCT